MTTVQLITNRVTTVQLITNRTTLVLDLRRDAYSQPLTLTVELWRALRPPRTRTWRLPL